MAIMIVLSAVVERLQYLFAEEGKCSQLITEDDKSLDSLRGLRVLLNDDRATHKYIEDENFAKQVRQLGKILYRIENLVESQQVRVASRDKVCMMRSILKLVANHNFRAGLSILTDQINGILALLQDSLVPVPDELGGFGLTRHSVVPFWDGKGIISSKHEEELVSALNRGSARVEVVSISGMAGTGKTTLAVKLYKSLNVSVNFPVRAWVTVSPKFRPRGIFLAILGNLEPLYSEIDDMGLAEKVYKHLKGRRWLVVLDDVWSIDVWESIRLAFPEDNVGSRILVTTRNRDVALSMSREGHICDVDFLDEEQSWELFRRAAQLTDTELHSKQEQFAKKIFRQSGGLPLAIVALANLLKRKSFYEWNLLLRDSEEIRETHGFEILRQNLDFSYNSLRSVLKPCLLYMGTYPEGSKIEVDTICLLWIAEGLVSTMEFAGNYFDELASRNLVQVSEETSTHQSFRYGCLHDLIRDICILKAKEEEFFEIVKLGRHANWPKDSVSRCAIYLDTHEKMDMHPYLRVDLRSLLFFSSYSQSGEDLICPREIRDLRNLKWIRILHFEDVDFEGGMLPPGVERFVLLRHLSLRECYLKNLPPYISNFLFLITLDLRVKKRCKVIIPNVLWKLEKLRHLYLPLEYQTPNNDKLRLYGLIALEILENFDVGICNVRDIFELTSLRHLAVSSEGHIEVLHHIINCIDGNANQLSKTSLDIRNFDSYSEKRLSFIEKLFSCRVLHILKLEGRMGKIPELAAAYASITEIHLNGSQLEDDPMQTLKGLPKLRILVLESEAYIGKEMYWSESGFPELRSLKLSKLYNLESWEVEIDAMPKLSTLTIENCRRMKRLPEELGYINALRELKINMMLKEFVDRLQKVDGKGGEDLDKINTKCTIEFGSDNLWPESTDSTTEISSSTGTRDLASSSACPPPNE